MALAGSLNTRPGVLLDTMSENEWKVCPAHTSGQASHALSRMIFSDHFQVFPPLPQTISSYYLLSVVLSHILSNVKTSGFLNSFLLLEESDPGLAEGVVTSFGLQKWVCTRSSNLHSHLFIYDRGKHTGSLKQNRGGVSFPCEAELQQHTFYISYYCHHK